MDMTKKKNMQQIRTRTSALAGRRLGNSKRHMLSLLLLLLLFMQMLLLFMQMLLLALMQMPIAGQTLILVELLNLRRTEADAPPALGGVGVTAAAAKRAGAAGCEVAVVRHAHSHGMHGCSSGGRAEGADVGCACGATVFAAAAAVAVAAAGNAAGICNRRSG